MQLDSAIKKRHSVRAFKKKKAPWDKVLEAINAAIEAPSAGNIANLKFILVEDHETIHKLAKHSHQSWMTKAGIVVVACSDDTNLETLYGERGRGYNKQHTGAAIENFLLKITDLGLAACWVGAYTDELIRSTLKIPSHIQVEALIPVGYEKPEKAHKKRKKALENVIYWEEWNKSKKKTKFEESKKELEK